MFDFSRKLNSAVGSHGNGFIWIGFAFCAAVAVAFPASAQTQTNSVTATAAVEILSPITITHDANAELHFGSIIPNNGGEVFVNTAGNYSTSGTITVTNASTPTADSFRVTGEANRLFIVTTDSGTLSDGNSSMNFTTEISNLAIGLDANGVANLLVGGRLTVSANQPTGNYVGSYRVTVAYN